MQRFKASLLVLAATALCLAQTATEYDSPTVMHVAGMMNCSCGCKLRMDCQMQPGCGTCKTARLKILSLQQQGKSTQQILDVFAEENGKDIVAVPPGTFGALASYSALAVGFGIVLLAIRYYRRPKPAAQGPAEDALLNRYHDQIEKDLEKLD